MVYLSTFIFLLSGLIFVFGYVLSCYSAIVAFENALKYSDLTRSAYIWSS